MQLRDQTKRKPSSNRLIEVAALRQRGQQPLVHCSRNAEVMVDRPTPELYLQPFSGFVVSDRRERGGLHGNNLHGMTSFWRPFALKQNIMKMFLSEQYWSYYRLAAEEMAFHLTQGDTGQAATEALAKGDFKYFLEPVRLVFGKSLVKSTVTGDIFEGVEPSPIPFARVRGYEAPQQAGVSIELGGPWAFYQQFCPAHNVGHVAHLVSPEVAIAPGERLHVPLLIHNGTGETQEVKLTVALPAGWTAAAGTAMYPVRPHESYPVQVFLASPQKDAPVLQEITWK